MRGFWSLPRRRGREDAELLATEKVHELRQVSYAQLRERVGRDDVEALDALDGRRLRRRTAVRRFTRAGGEELVITIRVDDGRLRTRLDPLAERLLTVGPDGEMTSQYTLAGEGNDPRRFA